MKKLNKRRYAYAAVFALVLLTEILIALFVHDSFVRPYGGDVLVTVLICAFARIFFPEKIKLLPVYVCIFAFAVEIGQYFDYVKLLDLDGNAFFSILMGRSFSLADMLCYATGCAVFYLCETAVLKMNKKTQ